MSAEHDESGTKTGEGGFVAVVTGFDPRDSIVAAAHALDAIGEPYALIGGIALDAWGIPRATKDADLAVRVGAAERAAERIANATTVIRPLSIGGVGIRDDVRELRIDLVDRRFHFAPLFGAAISEAKTANRRARVENCEIPLVSLEHLLAMKLVSGAPEDDSDVRRILQLDRLNYAMARTLVEQYLGPATANRLDALAREAGRPEVKPRRLYVNGDDADDE